MPSHRLLQPNTSLSRHAAIHAQLSDHIYPGICRFPMVCAQFSIAMLYDIVCRGSNHSPGRETGRAKPRKPCFLSPWGYLVWTPTASTSLYIQLASARAFSLLQLMCDVTYTWLYTCFCFLVLSSGESCTGIVWCSNSATSEQLYDWFSKKVNAEKPHSTQEGIWRFQLHCRDFSYQECNINNYVYVRLWKRSSAVLTGSAGCWRFVQSPWKLLDPKKFEQKEELHITLRIGNTLPTLQYIANTATHCQHSKQELKNRTQSTQYHNATIVFCVWETFGTW